ncbi:TIGR02452 family protein [Luteolibacter flavescens]|uniref:TIGR02452 family protein n=1 Tax=Luteolibacter flavescens TaxID=1859460 RepID=A0ABT3FML8_9BACT|nr:TIGR02452 family protein [Luteolibacter flavescens]MCW1884803.1 TIGR02452 family protein [Luteolibacter flavescens]
MRLQLKAKAEEVLQIVENGGYRNRAGEWVDIREAVDHAVAGTRLYRPVDSVGLMERSGDAQPGSGPVVTVTPETTQIAASRMVKEGAGDLVLLNFASARHPGGGFINGAKAQEEDLARCSALYHCLLPQKEYYDRNSSQPSMLYTDHLIYSPQVPWFRTRSRDEPDEVFLASVITAPAPNARQALLRGDTQDQIRVALERRCGQVLGVARAHGHRNLLLGAWGCGVFGNDPRMVAGAFKEWIDGPTFAGAFDQVVFAVFDGTEDQGTLRAFEETFRDRT